MLPLGIADRVTIIAERAEAAGHGTRRGPSTSWSLEVSPDLLRPPNVRPRFSAVGGRLVVSEPPGGHPDRWDPEGLALLGLTTSARG